MVTGHEVLGKSGKGDVPGRHYATGQTLKTFPQAYCLPGRIIAITASEDFVPGYRRFAPYCLPGR